MNQTAHSATIRGPRAFGAIWFGQLTSLFGSGLTSFGLGVWVYQLTGSATQYALITFFTIMPSLVISPLAGALVDRWDRRWAMIISDLGAGLCTLIIALLLMANRLEVWHIYLTMTASSIFSAFRWSAYSASTVLLVPKAQMGRASGMVQLGESVQLVVSPIAAGMLISTIKIEGVILIDFVTFLFAVVSLLLVQIPKPEMTTAGQTSKGSLRQETAYGWTYIRTRPGLLGLLLFLAATNFAVGFAQVLFTPLILSFASPEVLGTVMSFGGVGMLLGGLIMSAWGGPRRRIYGVLVPFLLLSLLFILGGLQPNAVLIAIVAFCFFFCFSVIVSSVQAIWQIKVAPDVQGRVFGVRRAVALSMRPLSFILAGPLIDQVFDPLLAKGGPLADSVGRLIGVGPGRGIGLFFMVLGVALIPLVISGWLNARLRLVEDELPDAIVAEAGTAVSEVETVASEAIV